MRTARHLSTAVSDCLSEEVKEVVFSQAARRRCTESQIRSRSNVYSYVFHFTAHYPEATLHAIVSFQFSAYDDLNHRHQTSRDLCTAWQPAESPVLWNEKILCVLTQAGRESCHVSRCQFCSLTIRRGRHHTCHVSRRCSFTANTQSTIGVADLESRM